MQKYILVLLMISCSALLFAQEWPEAIPLRQGVNIEWFRTGTETDDGCAIYVWSDTKLGARDLYAQKVNSAGNMVWGQPLLVDGKIDRQEDPVITRTSDGNFIIAWIDFSDDVDGNVYAQKINTDGQLLWQTGGAPVCVYPEIQISLNIEPDNAGGAYIVWEDSRNPGKDIYGQHLNAAGTPVWATNGIAITGMEGDESYNTMWADGTGGLIIGFVHSLVGTETLYVKRFLSSGQMAWAQSLTLSPSTGVQNKIKMAPINNDSFVFTWMDFRNTHPDIYAQRVDLSGSRLWPDPFIVYSDNGQPSPAPQENPRIVQTSDNGVIIVWEDKRNDADDPDLFAQKVSLTGQRLWSLDGVPVAVADFGQVGPRLSADNSGGSYIVWDDARNGNAPNIDIYMQHLTANGAAEWQENGVAVCSAPNEQSGSLIKKSGNNLFINWMDTRNGSVGIYYQVCNFQGSTQLPSNGAEVFWGLSGDATLKQVIVLPRQNDALVVWQDTRYANLGYQIFFQCINPDGSIDYEVNGRPVTTLTGNDQSSPDVAVLPDGSFAVVWEEKRTNNPKIYAQLIDASGNRIWGESGIAVTDSEPLRQKNPKISYTDGALYIGWSNLDDVDTSLGPRQLFHIYGQKIVGNQRIWGADGILISQYPASNALFECQMETLVERYYVWTRTSVDPADFGALNVWAKLMSPEGLTAPGWSDYGVVTSNYNDWDLSQYLPKAVVTSAGLFVGWLDFRSDFIKNLYGQLISPTGQILWDPSGVAMADYGREQDEFSLLGGNEITFSWKESLTGSNQDVAIQRYSLSGSALWGDMGFFVVERDTTQSSPCLARFSNGGIAVAWEDYYNESADIYMRFIESDGTLLGSNPGLLICDEIMIQQYPHIAVLPNETPNKALVIWSDGRSSGKTPIYGLYAQKVTNSTTGLEEQTDNHSDPILRLGQNSPNPFQEVTQIEFGLSKDDGWADLSVYNIKGQKVKTLHQGKLAKGSHKLFWDGKNDNGVSAANGLYYYKLRFKGESLVRKMILIR